MKLIYNIFIVQTIFCKWIKKNSIFIAITSLYEKLYNCVKKTVYQIKPEPLTNVWCNTVYIKSIYYRPNNNFASIYKKYFTRKWDYFENCIDLNTLINTDTELKSEVNEIILTNETIQKIKGLIPCLKKKYSITSELSLKLFILKLNSCYFTKIIYRINPQTIKIPVTYTKSNVKFMTIEYTHSLLKTPILIDLSEFNFTIESEILSFIFVYWYLNRKYGNWADKIFDLNYKLNIIDNDFNMFELKFYNYILLNENDYKINPYS